MNLQFPLSARDLGRHFDAEVVGNEATIVSCLATLETAESGALCFYSQKKFSALLSSLREVVLFTRADLVEPNRSVTYLVVKDPQSAFSEVAKQFVKYPQVDGVSPSAQIHPSVRLGEGASVGHYAVVEAGAEIGAGSRILPRAYVGEDVRVGKNSWIFPNVVILPNVVIGDRVKVFSGSVLGSDGFGYRRTVEGHEEVPQVGTVVIEDDVRIGAQVTIDRGTVKETRIGAGTKIDNLVHIAHNCTVGRNVIICAQVGLSGSVTLEDGVTLAGQVGLADHVVVEEGAMVGAKSGTSARLKAKEIYFGTPAVPLKESLRQIRLIRKLPELWEKIKQLEERLHGER